MRWAHVRVAGHFGELMQGRIGPDGPVALISLPCPALTLDAWHRPGRGLTLFGSGQRLLGPVMARRLLAALRIDLAGTIRLRAAMPVGGGGGASTASLVALARLADPTLAPLAIARACLHCEGASDPLMFAEPERLLWASREGRVLCQFPPLPRFDVIGGFYGPAQRTDPADSDFPDIADLVGPWNAAALRQDLAGLAQLATVSALRTMKHRRGGEDAEAGLMDGLGALGFVIAHTGSVRGFLFAPGRIPALAREVLREAGFRGVVQFGVGGGECRMRSSCSSP